MYTRCPQCQTVFRLTAAQLKLRGGQVRCGRCQHVFQAEQQLVEKPARAAGRPAAARKRGARKPHKPVAGAPPAPPADLPLPEPVATDGGAPGARPAVPDWHLRPNPASTRAIFWTLGVVLLALLLAAQAIVFYGQDIGRRVPALRDGVAMLCQYLPCQRLAPVDMRRLDLVETRVAPHPRYDRVLRVRATIVNRAERAQPYPLLEVTLIDRQGHVVARRTYPPREYLSKPEQAADGLPPQLAVNIGLDITSPGPQASGFEVLLLPPVE